MLGALADEATLPVVDVEPGDTLWDKAAEHLGAPHRWVEIAELNTDRMMADGRTFHDPNLILPDWQLRMPPDATNLTPAPLTAQEPEKLLANIDGLGKDTKNIVPMPDRPPPPIDWSPDAVWGWVMNEIDGYLWQRFPPWHGMPQSGNWFDVAQWAVYRTALTTGNLALAVRYVLHGGCGRGGPLPGRFPPS